MIALLAAAARWALFVLVIAAGVHAASVAYLPRFLMARTTARLASEFGVNKIAFPPPSGPGTEGLPLTNPNMLVGVCVFDLTQNNLRISAKVPDEGVWSVGFYGEDSAPFFFRSNTAVKSAGELDQVLVGPGALIDESQKGKILHAPSFRGVILFRTLIDSKASLAERDKLRRQAACQPFPR